jgi:putative membrane protein
MRAAVAIPVVLLAIVYTRGWLRISHTRRSAGVWARAALAIGGLGAVMVALSSPADELAHELFSAHMVQHLLLVSVAAPAILMSNPLAATLWGLPVWVRRHVCRLLAAASPARRLFQAVTFTPVAWMAHAVVLWVWHLPLVYDAALDGRIMHDAEHMLFFTSALLYWWPVIAPAPRVRIPPPPVIVIGYLVLGAFQTSALGLWLMTRSHALYAAYAVTPGAWGFTPLEDQAWGGVIMWTVSAVVDIAAVLAVLFRFFAKDGQRASAVLDPGPPPRDNRSVDA